MKKIVIKLPKKDRKVKETEEERKERIRMWRTTTTTRVIPDKRYKSRAQQRQEDYWEW